MDELTHVHILIP